MAISKIFIASSGRTLEVAKQLRAQLNKSMCEGTLWTEVSQEAVGKPIFQMLKEATNEYDFAVIILAQDDVMITKTNEELLKARDNCVFEAGLFMGAIGSERCFLLSSVGPANLPSDLAGIIHLPFKEPSNINNPAECKKETATAVTIIESKVFELGPTSNRPMSKEKLMDKQKSIEEGGELDEDQVVVVSEQPLDVTYRDAYQIRENIDKYNIQYIYFFRGNEDGAMKTCQLLQLVLLANTLDEKEARNFQARLQKLNSNTDGIKRDLERICGESMQIYFLPDAPTLEYCIHNARSTANARIYKLEHREQEGKQKDQYLEWASGSPAHQFWDDVRRARGADAPEPAKAMFYGVPEFRIDDPDFARQLKMAIRKYFPGMEDDVLRLCLGKNDEKLKQSQPVGTSGMARPG